MGINFTLNKCIQRGVIFTKNISNETDPKFYLNTLNCSEVVKNAAQDGGSNAHGLIGLKYSKLFTI